MTDEGTIHVDGEGTITPDELSDKSIEELQEELDIELVAWHNAGIDTQKLGHNTFQINNRLISLELYLVETLASIKGVEKKEIEAGMTHMLTRVTIAELKNIRAEIEPQMRAARLRAAGIEMPTLALPGENLKIN